MEKGGQRELTKREWAVLIKKVRFLIKEGCNSFRKVGIVGARGERGGLRGSMRFSGEAKSTCNRKIEASGISRV